MRVIVTPGADLQIRAIDGWWRENRQVAPKGQRIARAPMCRPSILCGLCFLVALGSVRSQEASDELPVVSVAKDAPRAAFLALARERGRVPQPDWSDMQATIWSIDPVRRSAERRRVLGHSHWAATPLLESPRLLRWQVATKGERFRLLRLDLETWEVADVLRSDHLRALGAAADKVYVQTTAGQCVLSGAKATPTPLELEIEVLATYDGGWLVVVDGALARFDAANTRVQRRYEFPLAHREPGTTATDWDGGRFAVMRGRFVDAAKQPIGALGFGQHAIVYRELAVWDLQAGTQSTVAVRLQARGGSGVGVIPMAMHTELVGGLFRYTERKPLDGAALTGLDAIDWERDVEWVTLDIANGKELLRVPFKPRDLPQRDVPADQRVPDFLRERFAASPIRAWGIQQDVAYAFLAHKGVDVPLSPRGPSKLDAVCRTADGERLLVLHRGTFWLCDLVRQDLTQWLAPESLAKADVELLSAR